MKDLFVMNVLKVDSKKPDEMPECVKMKHPFVCVTFGNRCVCIFVLIRDVQSTNPQRSLKKNYTKCTQNKFSLKPRGTVMIQNTSDPD